MATMESFTFTLVTLQTAYHSDRASARMTLSAAASIDPLDRFSSHSMEHSSARRSNLFRRVGRGAVGGGACSPPSGSLLQNIPLTLISARANLLFSILKGRGVFITSPPRRMLGCKIQRWAQIPLQFLIRRHHFVVTKMLGCIIPGIRIRPRALYDKYHDVGCC